VRDRFAKLARVASDVAGSPYAFIAAVGVVVVWGISGYWVGTSDTWQLIINTGTTIVTFLMIFLVQSSQNRDTRALHLKMDEIICSLDAASNKLISIERDGDEAMEAAQRNVAARKDT
jgi:low affinity Fe/Cu permease